MIEASDWRGLEEIISNETVTDCPGSIEVGLTERFFTV
jgi:hypothetical protein